MANNNDLLYAAALSGLNAAVSEGDMGQVTAGTIAASTQQATIATVAGAIDKAIPYDASISVVSTGVMLVTPFAGSGTAAQIMPLLVKPLILSEIVKSAFHGRSLNAYATVSPSLVAAGIAAQYAAAVAQLPAG